MPERSTSSGQAHDIAYPNGCASSGLSGGDTIAAPGSAANSERCPDHWLQSKSSFAAIVAEASGVATMLDQERRYIFGLTQAVSQIEDSFEKVHSRFTDIENRVASFESMCGRLSYRLDATLHAVQEGPDSDPRAAKRQAALQVAIDGAERKVAEHSAAIRLLTEENRTLREALTGVERNSRLVVDEVARLQTEVALRDRRDETAPAPEAMVAKAAQSAPVEAETTASRYVGETAAPPSEPPAQPPQTTDVAEPSAADDVDQLIVEITRSIDQHKSELRRMQEQAEALLARLASADNAPPRLAIDQIDADKQDSAPAPSRAASERQLVEIKALSSSYEALVHDLEQSRAALIGHSPAAVDVPPSTPPEPRHEPVQDGHGEAEEQPQEVAEAAAPEVLREPLPESRPVGASASVAEPAPVAEPASPDEPASFADPGRPHEPDREPAAPAEAPPPRPSQALSANHEISKINSLRAMYEKRTEELKAELMLERRERQFAESSLQVSRAERLQLQRELAKYRANGWRKISPDSDAEQGPSHDPEAVRRRISAA